MGKLKETLKCKTFKYVHYYENIFFLHIHVCVAYTYCVDIHINTFNMLSGSIHILNRCLIVTMQAMTATAIWRWWFVRRLTSVTRTLGPCAPPTLDRRLIEHFRWPWPVRGPCLESSCAFGSRSLAAVTWHFAKFWSIRTSYSVYTLIIFQL